MPFSPWCAVFMAPDGLLDGISVEPSDTDEAVEGLMPLGPWFEPGICARKRRIVSASSTLVPGGAIINRVRGRSGLKYSWFSLVKRGLLDRSTYIEEVYGVGQSPSITLKERIDCYNGRSRGSLLLVSINGGTTCSCVRRIEKRGVEVGKGEGLKVEGRSPKLEE